jgi:hypothetical protein
MPWGPGPWGGFAYGGGTIAAVYASSIRSVRVTLSVEPLEKASTTPGSVYNPTSWQLTRLDSGFVYNVLEIAKVEDKVYDVYTLEILGNANVPHKLDTIGLLDAGGFPI